MTRFRPISDAKASQRRAPPIHAVKLADLACVADALLADGRSDLAAQIVLVLYYCAERQIDTDNVVPLRVSSLGLR